MSIDLEEPPIGRRRWVWVDRKPGANYAGLVEYEPAPPTPRVHLISDHHEPFKSMADGKIYDAKSRYRREIKARGFEEVGNEKKAMMAREDRSVDWRPRINAALDAAGISD